MKNITPDRWTTPGPGQGNFETLSKDTWGRGRGKNRKEKRKEEERSLFREGGRDAETDDGAGRVELKRRYGTSGGEVGPLDVTLQDVSQQGTPERSINNWKILTFRKLRGRQEEAQEHGDARQGDPYQ